MADPFNNTEEEIETDEVDDSLEVVTNADSFDEHRAQTALDDLKADAQRCEGVLKREDLDRLYFKRQMTPSECVFVEIKLKEVGIVVEEEDEEKEILRIENSLEKAANPTAELFRRAKKAPYLTELEERECGRAIHLHLRAQDKQFDIAPTEYLKIEERANSARKRLVVSNLRWVACVAAKHPLHGNFDLQDLIQEGILGLMKSTDKYDPEMGFRFKTYANWWIRQSMERALKDKARTIRLPVHVQERITKLLRLRRSFTLQSGREPTYDELGKALGITAEKAALLSWYVNQSEVRSIDEQLGEDFSLKDILKDDHTPDPHQILEDKELNRILLAELSNLSPRQGQIIRWRFGLDLPSSMTLEEIGKKYGMTRERVRQIEAVALLKLAKKIPIKNLRKWFERG